jgi:hypothetical protein
VDAEFGFPSQGEIEFKERVSRLDNTEMKATISSGEMYQE